MDPKQEQQRQNRGAALWGNLVITAADSPAADLATNKDTGKVVWETAFPDTAERGHHHRRRSPSRTRSSSARPTATHGIRDWIAALDAATGKRLWLKYTVPAPGEPGSETWKDKNNAWQTGGAAVWVTGTYDAATNQTIWGTGNPVPMFDPTYRPGDNLYTNSAISWDPDTGKMNWYFQYTPGDHVGLRRGRHPHPDRRRWSRASRASSSPIRRATASSTRWTAYNGQIVMAQALYDNINWTKGIDQKTGKPLDYDPTKDIQTYSGVANHTPGEPAKKVCPAMLGGNNFWPSSYSPTTKLLYVPALIGCDDVKIDTDDALQGEGLERRRASRPPSARKQPHRVDPVTGEIKENVHLRYPNYSGTLATGGGLVFSASPMAPSRPSTTPRSTSCGRSMSARASHAPPMTFEVNGKQYVAIASGPNRPRRAAPTRRNSRTSATPPCFTCSGCDLIAYPLGAMRALVLPDRAQPRVISRRIATFRSTAATIMKRGEEKTRARGYR